MEGIEYRQLGAPEIGRELFSEFERRQKVTDCWRKIDGKWVVRRDPFIDQWSERDYEVLVKCLKNTAETGGLVLGAFADGKLKGLVSVEGRPMGRAGNYRDLSSLHVSEECRGMGIGRALFEAAADWARNQGAEKLYISGHSAVETQAFYRAMGCVEAQEYDPVHTAAEPYDCQLEFVFARTERRGENGTIS